MVGFPGARRGEIDIEVVRQTRFGLKSLVSQSRESPARATHKPMSRKVIF